MFRLRAHRLLSRLALVAILSLATLPTLGRLAVLIPPASHAMAMSGHAMAAGHLPERSPLPHDHGEDCAYCVLLSGVIPTAAVSFVVVAAPFTRFAGLRPNPGPIAGALGPGLGARGPPRNG